MSDAPAMSNYEYQVKRQESSLQYQLEFSDVINRIRKFLEGYYWDDFTKAFIAYEQDDDGNIIPLMAPKGINLVMRTLVALEHKGITLADLTENEARTYAQEIHRDLARTLFIHADEIGLAPTDIRQITKMISINIYAGFTRALKGSTADRLNRILQINENKITEGKKGVF